MHLALGEQGWEINMKSQLICNCQKAGHKQSKRGTSYTSRKKGNEKHKAAKPSLFIRADSRSLQRRQIRVKSYINACTHHVYVLLSMFCGWESVIWRMQAMQSCSRMLYDWWRVGHMLLHWISFNSWLISRKAFLTKCNNFLIEYSGAKDPSGWKNRFEAFFKQYILLFD